MSDINIGALSEAINDKMDRDLNNRSDNSGLRRLVESYVNGTSWYKIFDEIQSDGTVKKWCEQGGQASLTLGTGFVTVNFLKAFTEVPNILISMKGVYYNTPFNGQHGNNAQTASTTGFTTYIDSNVPYKNWIAQGYI